MIQRKQTLFLLLAIILQLVCLCLPIGRLIPEGMGAPSEVYNLWVINADGSHNYSVWPLFALLLLACPVEIVAIALFKKRMIQAKLCLLAAVLLIGWCAYYAFCYTSLPADSGQTFRVGFAAALPIVAFVLTLLARNGVIADEKLVRSMDRIR